MKKIMLILMVFMIIPLVSAELAFEFFVKEENGKIQLQETGVVEIPASQIQKTIIGEYLMVIGNKNLDSEYINGAFFSLPETTIYTYVDENGDLYSEYKDSYQTKVYIPYNEDANYMKIFKHTGENIIHFDLDTRNHLPLEHEYVQGTKPTNNSPTSFKDDGQITIEDWDAFFNQKRISMEELKKQESTKETYFISLIIIIIALIIILVVLYIKLRREKRK